MRAVNHEARTGADTRLIDVVLGNLTLFRGVPPALRASLAAQCWTLPLARGSLLVRLGEQLPGVVAVAYGALKLRLPANGGKERVVRLVAAGESFGEAAALLGRPAPYEPVALCAAKLLLITAIAILSVIERDPRAARGVVFSLAERNLHLLEELHTSAPRRGLQRLACYLESVAEPGPGGGESRARLPGTKTLVAAQLGMSKETLSRLLRSLATRGLVRLTRGDIDILDRPALAVLAAKHDCS